MTQEQQIELEKWNTFIIENIKGSRQQRMLSLYVERLIRHDTVVILDFGHLAKLLGLSVKLLSKIIMAPDKFYHTFGMPKRNGGTRMISAPTPVLLCAQRWIYDNILKRIAVHENAKGFVRGVSIVDNARPHLEQNYLLKMDIENFFPSIKLNRVMAIFRNLGYTKKVSYYLSSICCLDGALPQGAPTSPSISNIIARRMDYRMSGLAERFSLTYTRYADDFTFSGKRIPPVIIQYIEEIVNSEGFNINKGKTHLIGPNRQKIITGISISANKLTIPRKKKREVRQCIYYVLKNGIDEHQRHIGSYDPIYVERLLGYLFFWLSVEPDNIFVKTSINKLKAYSRYLDNLYNTMKV